MSFEQARFNMIEQQIRPWEVLDQSVLDLLFSVRREEFVPAAMQRLAFADAEIPLGHGAVMLAPKIEAHALQAVQVKKHESVLEIGAGSGYMAALLAKQREMTEALEAFRKSRASAAPSAAQGGGPNPAERMDAVAGAFDRIYARQTGLSGTDRTNTLDQAAKLKELDDLVRDNKIAERMAQLKAVKP